MKYIREYKSNFDIDFAIAKIKEHFKTEDVKKMFDQEVLEWIDDNWQEGFETQLDWYVDHNNGEAQDSVINQIIKWYVSKFDNNLSDKDKMDLFKLIQLEYKILEY
jgi:hypothetical protein